jgi:uncharacterized protein
MLLSMTHFGLCGILILPMINMDNLVILATVFLSELLGTIVVFGSSAFYMPVAINFMTKNQSLGLLSFFQVIGNTIKFLLTFKKIDWKIFFFFGLPSLLMVYIGSRLTVYVNGNTFRMALGGVLLALVTFELFKQYHIPKNPITELTGGIISGFVSGLIGTGGAIRGYFLFNFTLSKEVLIATYCAIDYSGDILRMLVYYSNGFFDSRVIGLIPLSIVAAILGNIIGLKILKHIPVKIFNKSLLLVLLVLAILLIL